MTETHEHLEVWTLILMFSLTPWRIFVLTSVYYYCLAPLALVLKGDYTLLGSDVRAGIVGGVATGLAGAFAFALGYGLPLRPIKSVVPGIQTNVEAIRLAAKVLLFLGGLSTLILMYSGALNARLIWDADSQLQLSQRSSFASALMMLLIPGVALSLAAAKRFQLRHGILLLVVLAAFVAVGTRIYVLYIAMICLYVYLERKGQRLGVMRAVLFTAIAYIVFSAFAAYRVRYGGLDLSRSFTASELLLWGLREGEMVFKTFALLLQRMPSDVDFLGFVPVGSAVMAVVPRYLWPGKPEIAPEIEVLTTVIGASEAVFLGAAVPFFGGCYMIYGHASVLVISFLLGALIKTLWKSAILHRREAAAMGLFSMLAPFLYGVLSRGYFAQSVVMGIAMFVIPVLLINLTGLLLRRGNRAPAESAQWSRGGQGR